MLKKIAPKIIIGILSLYVLMCLAAYVFQANFMFYPLKTVYAPPAHLNIEEVNFTAEDGVNLSGWYLKAENAEKTVLFSHGNAGNIYYRAQQFEVFNKLNLNAFVYDYRGFGKSEGRIKKEEDLYSDSRGAWNYLIERKALKPEDIIIWGHSLGGAVSIDLASEKEAFAVIVESTFFSMEEIASELVWFLPIKHLLKYEFRSDLKIKDIKSKLLIIHSTEDELIPYAHGEKLYKNAPESKRFLQINGGHNEGCYYSEEVYVEGIRKFLGNM